MLLKGRIRDVYKQMGKAIADYGMLADGDRILIGVSGGVDSLVLLKLFQMRQARIPIKFDIIACFIDTNFIKIKKRALAEYVKSCGVDYVVKKLVIDKDDVNCFWCSWNRRKLLFQTAKKYNCNKIALGHNLDDTAETMLMNLFYLGEISTMSPKVNLFKGQITMIRPLCYLDKHLISEVASNFSFPDTQYQCCYGKDSRRQFIKELITKVETNIPFVKKNIVSSLKRIKEEYLV
ncbi:MAG: tRNA 2-thiocytidine(32) synthetase TtcA [Candidatus Omnitrophica bacterium]|nr:tRNA 2-thiocytidine(32) synthetase TtcA [Candidatus Omnitrophota bacterium]